MRRQQGMASILVTVLVGVALVGLLLGTNYALKGTQDATFTAHTLTQAQLKAWNGVEDLRQALYQMGVSGAQNLTAGSRISRNGAAGISGNLVSVSTSSSQCSSGVLVVANMTGTSAQSSATVQAVYCVTGSSSTTTSISTININGNLTLSGSIGIVNGNNTNTSFVVKGNITNSGGSIGTFSTLYATGTISLTGASISANTVAAEGDITLANSGNYTTVSSMGNIGITGGVSAVSVNANKNVTMNAGASATTVKAIGDVTLGSGVKVGSLYTQGNTTVNSSTISNLLQGQGRFIEQGWSVVNNGQVGGSVNKNGDSSDNVVQIPGLTVPMTPMTARTVTSPVIDAWLLKSAANYIFDVDSSNRKVVTVSNVTGLANGTYYLTGSGDKQDYLCSSTSYNSATCYAKICNGYSAYNSCFSDYTGSVWTLNGSQSNGSTLATGVVWFHGDVQLGVGNFYSTVLSSGNISTSGSTVVKAPNYAGAAGICSSSFTVTPSNLCSSGSYSGTALENIALLAGGYQAGTFSGGNIALGSGNMIYGDVLVGGLLSTTGSTTIYGYINIANQTASSTSSSFGNSTTINLSNLPSTYDPSTIPNGNSGAASTTSVDLVWTRYL